MVTFTSYVGWGRNTWGSGPWSGSIYVLAVDGVSATASVGTVTVTGGATTAVSGLSSTVSLGSVSAIGGAVTGPSGLEIVASVGEVVITAGVGVDVTITGFGLTASLGAVAVYVEVTDPTTETWTEIIDPAVPTWVSAQTDAAYTWTEVAT